MLALGTAPAQINAGDQLALFVNSLQGKFASLAGLIADGVNHAYVTSYAGGLIGSTRVPAGCSLAWKT